MNHRTGSKSDVSANLNERPLCDHIPDVQLYEIKVGNRPEVETIALALTRAIRPLSSGSLPESPERMLGVERPKQLRPPR